MNFFRDNKNSILLVTASVLFIVVMIISSAGKPSAGIVSDAFGVLLKPFQSVGSFISNCFEYADNADKYKNENILLKEQLIIANEKAKNYDELADENLRLRSMLELQINSKEFNLKAATVTASDTESWTSVIKLDKGLSDGIKKNDAVITEIGLVGYVCEVGRNWSKVVTIIDTSVSVSAKLEKNNEYCIVEGSASLIDEGFCSMKYVTTETPISTGDKLVTTGEGGIFPEGIVIGRVNDVKVNTNGLSQDAVVEPAVNISDLSEVFVVIK
ncbi:MAG: rod shape-determining protein MreC [Clostridia bacterium]|nr:rod shape-determining protein MreC [Clostridia bacterium]